ncbi:Uncharacterized protein FWK35_00025622 [Aphis craccivora]|uniref:Uncharacterized protein n=1 Tax=Aphis craccivora TaxID=307492 RepID=A0A6G0YDN2_APHCR|nr:Uncharacterized protein FWK35_00025622 [Aphis craccivora]
MFGWNTFNIRYVYFFSNSFVIKFIRFLNFSSISSSIAKDNAALLFFFISGCFVVFLVLFFRAFLILFFLYASFLCFNQFMLNWTSSISLVSFLIIFFFVHL